MSTLCWLCNQETLSKSVQLRSKKEALIQYCGSCHFEFFSHENKSLLIGDQLDKTRLQSAGLDIPKQEKDFENGYKQSQSYIQEYLTKEDIGKNILEIGCSWGYFLKAVREFGAVPYGVEINPVRASYVAENLNIRCEADIEKYHSSAIKFKKIFSFYCLEYIKNPIDFFKRLFDLLEDGGEMIFITPNLDDVLKDIWKNKGYQDFFYDECAIAYYSSQAVKSLVHVLKKEHDDLKETIYTQQGYSFYNHLHWYFNQKPINNNSLVGGDHLSEDLRQVFGAKKDKISLELVKIIDDFDVQYRKVIEGNDLGNQIIMRIQKNDL